MAESRMTELAAEILGANAAQTLTKEIWVAASPETRQQWADGILIYRNHKGEVRLRKVRPLGVVFGGYAAHGTVGTWMLRAIDLQKNAECLFAIRDILHWVG